MDAQATYRRPLRPPGPLRPPLPRESSVRRVLPGWNRFTCARASWTACARRDAHGPRLSPWRACAVSALERATSVRWRFPSLRTWWQMLILGRGAAIVAVVAVAVVAVVVVVAVVPVLAVVPLPLPRPRFPVVRSTPSCRSSMSSRS